jgi:hypothetical protein
MTDINIILDTDFNIDSNISQNDKEIFYEQLNKELNIYKYNTYSNYKIEYNKIIEDFLYNDNYLEYESNLLNINSDIKTLLLKKLLTFYTPIINIDNFINLLKLYNSIQSNKDSKKIIIDRNNINLNYPISAIFKIGNKEIIKSIISLNTSFLINGLYNTNNYNNNLPYNLNKYKFSNLLIIELLSIFYNENIQIFLKSLNYNNKGNINIDKINNNDLLDLYKLYINASNIYFNNAYYITNISNFLYKEYNIIKDIQIYNKKQIILVNEKYNLNYITEFNKFLSYKINNNFNNHSYFAFKSNDLLELYEKILIYSIDNKDIKNEINTIITTENNKKIYKNNKKIVNEYNLKLMQLELLTKKKFPNLFNPNSKEILFTKYKPFDFDNLPKKYREIIILEYKKLENYKQEYAKNKCIHKELITNLSLSNNKYPIITEINKLIKNPNSTDDFYKCIICSYNLICPHIIEYYNLLFDKKQKDNNEFSIRQRILNKYMSDSKINMIYYCKVCGEELGKSLDLEQNIEYKDKVKLNTAEYTDETIELVKNNLNYIIYTYITFTELNLNITKKYLFNYILNNILFYINNVEKTIRKSKLYNEEMIINLLNFNSIIFIYANLIYIMSKHPYISFINLRNKIGKKETTNILSKSNNSIIIQKKKSSSIIIPKKVQITSTKDLLTLMKVRFKEAYDLIINSNYILLNKLKYINNLEKIKDLLVKTYGIIAQSDKEELNLIDKNKVNISNKNLLLNSNIYNYYYFIKSIYPLSKNKSNYINSLSISNNLLISNNKKLDINNIEFILNKNQVNNKLDNLFNSFNSPIILDLNNIKSINNYEEYKIISFNLFNYHIYKELYNLPIYDIIENKKQILEKKNNILKSAVLDNIYIDIIKKINNDELYENYKNYIKISQILKTYEINIINQNLLYNLYPYSLINLNNLRYFTSKDINLNIYFCKKDGLPHKYNIYIFKVNNKEVEIEKNKLDNFINSTSKEKKLEFIDYKCIKCSQYKNKLYLENKYNNDSINNLMLEINDINGFFNLYLNVCPIITKLGNYQFHDFDYTKSDNIVCKICKINYNDLISKNKDIYYKYNKEYETYKNNKLTKFNLSLDNYTNKINVLKNKDIKSLNQDLLNKLNNNIYIDKINKLNLDNIIVEISKLYNINIILLQKIGLTEGIKYDDLSKINIQYDNIDNRLNKLNNYMRTLLIYYNLLKNNKMINNYFDYEFNDILHNLKDINNKLFNELPDYNLNLSNILTYLKLTNTNKDIVNFYIKAIYNFIIEINKINKTKFNNKLDIFIKFILNKVLKFDELFSNYNYSQLKQMFTEDKYDINYTFEENQEYENEEDDELFGYNDLNINFEDEEPIDE